MEASDLWFRNWQPHTTITGRHPVPIIPQESFQDGNGRRQSSNPINIANFLPYIISMGIVSPLKEHFSSRSSRIKRPPIPLETTGPFKTWYYWKQLDFAFVSQLHRQEAIASNKYIPENNLPLGIGVDTLQSRLFLTIPKWKKGIPCTLAVVPLVSSEPSPLLAPYPNWDFYNIDTCDGLVSVFRIEIDSCNRLWVLDSGQADAPTQNCPPKIMIFNLSTDQMILRYDLPNELIKQDGLFSNIAVDIRKGDCAGAHAYLADVWRFGLVVFNLKEQKSWRVTDHLFYPDPLASAYKVGDINFDWTDGIFSLALSPELAITKERLLYFHPMSSFREFYVKTSVIRNETGWSVSKDSFKLLGGSRGKSGHASTAKMDKNGILFYTLVTRDSVGCWDSRKPYKRVNLGVVAKNNVTLMFPNDLKLDEAYRPSVWILSNRLPQFLFKDLDKSDYNFRIMSSYIDEAIEGTVCDPKAQQYNSYIINEDVDDCY